MTPDEINLYLQIAGGAATAGASAWAGWKYVLPLFDAWMAKRKEWQTAMNALPEALKKIAGIDALAAKIERIHHAVMPNNGSSIPDKLAAIALGIEEGREQRNQLAKDLATVSHTIKASQNANPNIAGFEARPDGRLISVTKTFTRWTGVESSDLLGWNWINTLHPEDKSRVRAEFMSAVSDVRNCTIRFSLLNLATQLAEEVEMTMTSIPENTSPCERFVGSIYKVNHADNP